MNFSSAQKINAEGHTDLSGETGTLVVPSGESFSKMQQFEELKARDEKRKANNRRSALESRKRKKKLIENLSAEVSTMSNEIATLRSRLALLQGQLESTRQENALLRLAVLPPTTTTTAATDRVQVPVQQQQQVGSPSEQVDAATASLANFIGTTNKLHLLSAESNALMRLLQSKNIAQHQSFLG